MDSIRLSWPLSTNSIAVRTDFSLFVRGQAGFAMLCKRYGSKGARVAKGLTIGILPTKDRAFISEAVDIPIITDMGSARNNINVLSSDVVIACGVCTL